MSDFLAPQEDQERAKIAANRSQRQAAGEFFTPEADANAYQTPVDKEAHYGYRPPDITGGDVQHSWGTGLQNGISGLLSTLSAGGEPIQPAAETLNRLHDANTQINNAEHRLTGPAYQPQTVPGQYASTIASMAPNALLGGGGPGARALQVIAPGVMSETAGQITKGSEFEGPARLAGAVVGGGVAAGFGGAADAGTNALTRGLTNFADSRQAATGNQVNSLFGGFQPREAGAAGPMPGTPRATDAQLLRLAGRRGLTDQKAEELATEAEAAGRNPIAAQVLGEPGLRRLQTVNRMPGKSAQRSADVIGAKRAGQGERLATATDQAFGDQTRSAAQSSLNGDYASMSPRYNELLDGAKIDSNAYNGKIVPVLQTIPQSIGREITKKAEAVAEGEGVQNFDALPIGRQLQYTKVALGQKIANMGRDGLDANIRRNLTRTLNNLRTEMETAIPGYKQINAQWADAAQSEDALSWSDQLFAGGKNSMRPEEVKAQFDAFTPAQQQHALVSVRNRIMQTIEDRTKTGVRKTNVSEPFLSDTFNKRMRAILGDKAEPLLRSIGVEDKDFNELGSVIPRAGSDTAPMFADMIDQATMTPNPKNWIGDASKFAWQKATSPIFENARNKVGDKLLAEMTPDQIRTFRKALRENLIANAQRSGGAARTTAAGAASANEGRQ